MNSYIIVEGDDVRHVNPMINFGLKMTVEKIDEDELNAQCSHFVGQEMIHTVEWFPLINLILLTKAGGGFIK